MSNVQLPQEVVERVNNELVRAILETPDYVRKVVDGLLKEASNTSGDYNDPDRGKPLFEKILRRELRVLVKEAIVKNLRTTYTEPVQEMVDERMAEEVKLEGSLAGAFHRMLAQEFQVSVNVTFNLERDR